MPKLYADAAYYIALLVRRDRLHEPAVALSATLESVATVTSDPVLVEVLAYVSKRRHHSRSLGLAFVDALRANRSVTIVRQTPDLFDTGLELYRHRLDKGYSLTDCMSMIVCRQLDLTQILTHDHHFAQEGFEILL